MDFSKKFDLTTKEGFDNVNKVLILCNPILGLGVYAVRKIFASAPSAEEQQKAAIELIQEAKKQGAKSMDFTISSEAGGHLEFPLEEGINISMGAGSKGKTEVHIEFA